MAFQLTRLISGGDLPAPSIEEVLKILSVAESFIVEGQDGAATASFYMEVNDDVHFVQVEALGDLDQFILTNRARGDGLQRFVTAYGDVYRYAAFCLIDRGLAERALRHFLQTGMRAEDLCWESASELLRSDHIEFE